MITTNKVLGEIKSFRSYVLYMSDTAYEPVMKTLVDIIQDSLVGDYEFAHSLMQDLDKVLDLRPDETMVFLYNRDNPNSKSIIKRIQ